MLVFIYPKRTPKYCKSRVCVRVYLRINTLIMFLYYPRIHIG